MIAAVETWLGIDMAAEPLSPETTVELLDRVRRGDDDALDRLLERCLPPLRRWAHSRLPPSLRGVQETADLVQDAVVAALRHLDSFEVRHQGALQASLRQAVLDRIRDLARQSKRRPRQSPLVDDPPDAGASPLEQAIGAEKVCRYEAAVDRLSPQDREAIIGRLELQYGYQELAVMLGTPGADAARTSVTRALRRLAQELIRE